jgi:rhamnogalacturonan endolyase
MNLHTSGFVVLLLGVACATQGGGDGGTDAVLGTGGATPTGTGGLTSSGGTVGGGGALPGSGGSGGSGMLTGGAGGSGGTTATGGGSPDDPTGFAQLERLDRGVVAVPTQGGILVSWRLFGYDQVDLGFNVYRDGVKVNDTPITTSTNFVDSAGSAASVYTVRALAAGVELEDSEPADVWENGYFEIPTPVPPGGTNEDGAYTYTSSDASVGDLDGDGRYDVVLKWDPSNAQDNSKAGHTGNVYIDGYTMAGEQLWRIDLGVNIRAGAHYTQFMVYDLDGDGVAEVAMKTAPGSRDASGEYLATGPAADDDDNVDYRNADGYILSGPEYLTIFDGLTGGELVTVPFQVARGNVGDWGDTYGNRVDRFLGTIAFLDDTGRPSLVMGRGMYTRTTFSVWNYRDGQLSLAFISDNPGSGDYAGKGAHGISVANVDADPMQEIIGGSATFDHDGTPICAVPFYGHGDALHVSDLIPSRPGQEVFMPFEADQVPQYGMRDALTCELVWQGPNTPADGEGPGRGVAGDVDPSSPGAEAWVSGGGLLRGETGQNYANKPQFDNFLVWWDGDLSREILDSNTVRQYDDAGGILTADGCSSNNGTKSTPTLVADVIGDWREEVVFRCGSSIRVYSTGEETGARIHTLMHDPQYRVAISWQNVEYNQPPHPSFHIGEGMAPPPVPDMTLP